MCLRDVTFMLFFINLAKFEAVGAVIGRCDVSACIKHRSKTITPPPPGTLGESLHCARTARYF